MNILPPIAEMERAYLKRDPAYNGLFFVGVRTTMVFCRPTCPARSPLPKNVEYFPTAAEALFAGYRPCKRCRPMTIDDQPDWAAKLVEDVERDPASRIAEGDLQRRGVDPATVRRHFLRRYGMTFQAYTRSRRLSRAFNCIRNGMTLDNVIVTSGYDSHSGFREAFRQVLGCAPGDSRNRRCVFLTWMQTPLGPMIAGATDDGVCLLAQDGIRHVLYAHVSGLIHDGCSHGNQSTSVSCGLAVTVVPGNGSTPHGSRHASNLECMDHRKDIRDFLTSRRSRITPDRAGLPAYGGKRRVAGLRREEVALLAGVSVDYYTRLELGNLTGVS